MLLDINSARKDKALIVVKAKITLKTSEEGGKSNPIRTGYRPNHVFIQPKNIKELSTYIGEIQFSDYEFIYPGETKIVEIIFARGGEIDKYINVGQKWFLYEVPKLVGEGEILEIQ